MSTQLTPQLPLLWTSLAYTKVTPKQFIHTSSHSYIPICHIILILTYTTSINTHICSNLLQISSDISHP
jgi:hypothetical protein